MYNLKAIGDNSTQLGDQPTLRMFEFINNEETGENLIYSYSEGDILSFENAQYIVVGTMNHNTGNEYLIVQLDQYTKTQKEGKNENI